MSEEPRPATASIRPGAIAAAVASCSNTRSGSSVDSTVTAVPNPIRWVEAAAALTSEVGEGMGIDGVWCSPKPKKSRPACSATCTASSTSRMA
jgi:hypothetical protein